MHSHLVIRRGHSRASGCILTLKRKLLHGGHPRTPARRVERMHSHLEAKIITLYYCIRLPEGRGGPGVSPVKLNFVLTII